MTSVRNQISAIAGQEGTVHARNRWTLVTAVTFAVLVVSIAAAGTLAEGFEGVQSFRRTSTSLVNLVLIFVPLLALMVSTQSFTGDRGSAELLFSQPVRRWVVLLGKTLGIIASLWGSMMLGFTAAGAIILAAAGLDGLAPYLWLVLLSLLLAAVFVSVAAATAVLSGRKARAFGIALTVWFLFVLFYDLLVIGAVTLMDGPAATTTLFLSLFGNPVDLVRVAALLSMENATIFGAAGAALVRFLGGGVWSALALATGLLLWIAVPWLIACRSLHRQDL